MSDQCPKCHDYRNGGAPFCGACGNMLDCPECDNYHRAGDAFCGNCGSRLYVTLYIQPPAKVGLLFKLSFLLFVFVSIYAVADIVLIAVKFFDILTFLGTQSYGLLILIPDPYVFLRFSGAGTQLYWVFLVFMIMASFSLSVRELVIKVGSPKSLTDKEKIEKTSPFWVSVMWPATIVLQMALIFLLTAISGQNLDVPEFDSDLRADMFVLASAGVWEEIITRVLIIGVPMTAIAFINGKKDSWLNLWGGFGMSKVSMVLIIVSSFIFGYGHVEGWGFVKLVPAFVFGMACGYLYVRFGLHAAIMLHFINDYVSVFFWAGLSVTGVILMFALYVAGAVALLVLIVRGYGFAKDFKNQPVLPPSVEKDG